LSGLRWNVRRETLVPGIYYLSLFSTHRVLAPHPRHTHTHKIWRAGCLPWTFHWRRKC
jgi:hypothetical protein